MDEAVEMTCTMRHWQQDVESSAASNQSSQVSSGPELVLMEVQVISPMSKRAESPASVRPCRSNNFMAAQELKPQPPVHVPLTDIMIVENRGDSLRKSMDTSQRGIHKIRITTQHNGFFVFESLSMNSHDVLFAFLQANISAEKFKSLDQSHDDESCPSTASTASLMSLDVERFTAEKIEGASQRERWSDRLARKFGKIATGVSEVCMSVCDTACCRPAKVDSVDTAMPPAPTGICPVKHAKSIKLRQGNLEVDDSLSVVSSTARKTFMRGNFHMPSGLSMEPDCTSHHSESLNGQSTVYKQKRFRDSLKQFHMPAGLSVETEDL